MIHLNVRFLINTRRRFLLFILFIIIFHVSWRVFWLREKLENVCFSEKERQRYAERMGDLSQSVARPASNTTLLAKYCKDKVPRTCDHAILQNTSRPCSLGESFVSSGSSLTIEMRMVESTALRQVLIAKSICYRAGVWRTKFIYTIRIFYHTLEDIWRL